MWGASMEPPAAMEDDSSETIDSAKDTCEQNKSQLESLKEIMLRNKQTLKKKEEEVQEYARKLSKIKSRAKLSHRSKDGATSSSDTALQTMPELALPEIGGSMDDISLAKTPQAKSSLLQRKLAENRKIFEQRSKEMTESKRAVEEKVEAIRQQLDERDLSIVETQRERMVTPVRPIVLASQVTTPTLQLGHLQDKDNKIAELSNRVVELEATVLDLQENLKEKDSVIDARTKAITLLSADLSKKGKTTLDTLEETKDEMRTMQENFVLLESSLKNKNDNLLDQLSERNDRIEELENVVKGFEERLEKQQLAEAASADFSRSAMDTLADTKDAMKSMQENFVLIESTLKSKNDHLIEQLEEREAKLTAAEARIFQLESGAGLVKEPAVADLEYKLEKLEQSYRQLQDQKYELQKSIVELQEKIIANESSSGNGLIIEKDNRIAELENLIEELRRSNELLEEESKSELQKQIVELTSKNEDYSNKINNLERLVHDLESEKNDLAKRVPDDGCETTEDARVQRLTRELEDLNKSMIKLKAQHKSKVKSFQKQLENFKMVSDANAELVKLGNQVTLLEEEKASAGDWQSRVADLDSKVSAQAIEIESHIQAIATLENQKLDLMQELHAAKQEISTLEAENAESENLRVTAEMKIVELEEQLEWLHKSQNETEESEVAIEQEQTDLLKKFDVLKVTNQELYENFVKLEEKNGSNASSSESFETINESEKIELQKKIDLLTREKSDLLMKLEKLEEKGGSSNSGSTESFERVPAQGDTLSKIELLTRDNNELITKVAKLEERLAQFEENQADAERESWSSNDRATMQLQERLKHLTNENSDLVIQLTKLQERLADVSYEDPEERRLRERLGTLTEENNQLVIKVVKLEEINAHLSETLGKVSREKDELLSKIDQITTDSFARERLELIEKLEKLNREKESVALERQELHEEISTLLQKSTEESTEGQSVAAGESPEEIEIEKRIVTVASLEGEIEECKRLIAEQKDLIEEMKLKLTVKEEELNIKERLIAEQEAAGKSVENLKRELEESLTVIEEWKLKCTEMQSKMEVLEAGKLLIDEGLRSLQNEYKHLLEQSEGKDVTILELKEELEGTMARFESRLQMEVSRHVAAKDAEIETLMGAIAIKDKELSAALEDQLNAYRTESQQSSVMIKSLREEVDRLEGCVRVRKSQEEFDHLVERVDEAEKLASSLEDKLKEQVELNSLLRTEIEQQVTLCRDQANARLAEKDKEIADLLEQLRGASGANLELQKQLESSNAYVNDILKELNGVYKKLEQLKVKHTEDTAMQNRRLEDLLEELSSRTQENECLRSELEEKRRDFGEEAKAALEKELQESETRSQSLREKMKVYAANLKKKATQCQELEARVAELEEKWSTEKDEKEATNRRIQELEKNLIEKDNRMAEVEGNLARAQSETTAALENVDRLTKEIGTSREQVSSLLAEITEMSQEMEKLRREVERHSAEAEEARAQSRAIASEYESYKGSVVSDRERELLALEEAKENARELSVRMQVMEAEYVDQLGLIQKLKTENGLLSSKETEINERLENVAKESEERRVLLERLRSRKDNAEPVGTLEDVEGSGSRAEEPKSSGVDRCERCEQCQMLVQALEAKLQEREAEIENLDNELAKSIGNFVQMREALRYSEMISQSGNRNVSIEESYNQLLFQHNALASSNEEIKEKLDLTIRENQELTEKINGLQALNSALQERIDAAERELVDGREVVIKLQNIDLLYSELSEKCKRLEEELERAHREFSVKEDQFLESSANLKGEIQSLRKDLSEAERKASDFESKFEGQKEEIALLKEETKSSRDNSAETPVTIPLLESDAPEKSATPPALFDASKIFGTGLTSNAEHLVEISRLRNILSERDEKDALVVDERDRLSRQLAEERLQVEENNAEYGRQLRNLQQDYERLQQELSSAQEVLLVRNRQIETLNVELNNVGAQLQLQFERQGAIQDSTAKLQSVINHKDDEILKIRMELNAAVEVSESLTASRDEMEKLLEEKVALIETLQRERTAFIGELDELKYEKQEAEKIVDHIIAVAEDRVNAMNETNLSTKSDTGEATGLLKVENRLTEILGELENVKRERDALVASQEACRDRILELEGGAATNQRCLQDAPDMVVDAARVQELEERIGTILQERDLLQLQVNDLTRSLNASMGSMQEEPAGGKVSVVPLEKKERNVDQSEVGSGWDVESTGRLEVDEDGWGWNSEVARLSEEHHAAVTPLIPSLEVQLETRIAELEDRIRDLETEKQNLEEEKTLVQTRNGKLVRKLKEYKVQNGNLHQQLKSQRSVVGFCDLDSAIEEELKLQIANLEKTLAEVKNELKKMIAEKAALEKRLDVLTAANERLVEMKERQDLDVEVCQIRNKELANKVQSLEWQLQAAAQGSSPAGAPTSRTSEQLREERGDESEAVGSETVQKYKEELDDLRSEMEALATENEQLQKVLEEHRQQRLTFESNVSAGGVEDMAERNNELQSKLDKLKEEYDLLRKQYEQSLMDANDQITAMRENCEILKSELNAKTEEFEAVLQDRTRISGTEVADLRMQLRTALEEKAALTNKVESLKSVEEKFASATSSTAEMSELLNARVQEVADLKQELQQLYVERTQAEEKLEERERKLSKDLKDKQEEIETLKRAFAEQEGVERVSAIVGEATQGLLQHHALELESKDDMMRRLRDQLNEMESSLECATAELEGHRRSVNEQHSEIQRLEALLIEKDEAIANKEVKLQSSIAETHRLRSCVTQAEASIAEPECTAECLANREVLVNLRDSLGENERVVQSLQTDLENERMRISVLNQSLREKEAEIEVGRESLVEKEALLRNANQRLEELQEERERLEKAAVSATAQTVDGLPVFRMPGSEKEELRSNVDRLKSQLETKQAEIENLQYILSENAYPKIIQELQDNVNELHNQKEELEASLEAATRKFHQEVGVRERELADLRRQEEAAAISGEGRHPHEQEEILRLQNELHQREQEINELKYILAEKSAQLSLQASLEPQSDEFELRETAQRLNAELYSKDQQLEKLKKSLAEKESEVAKLSTLERLLSEYESTIARLNSEKEEIRLEAEESLRRRSNEVEREIDAMKERLAKEKQEFLGILLTKDEDLRNIRVQLEEGTAEFNRELHRKEEELSQVRSELAEKERRLAELSVTKDTEIHNLRVQIQEKEARIEELHALTNEEERQLVELRKLLTAKDEEINLLKQQLTDKVQEYELLQRALKREIRSVEAEIAAGTSATARPPAGDTEKGSASAELDLALYMLHQRDVRCEELTVELMHLLEERDTLQLRLSNAIRINEELRKAASIGIGLRDDQSPGSENEPLVEQPSPSKSEGPVEIAKEAIDAPIGEDKEALAQKLSQLHNVGLTRDVRLRDERELRHTQQMSLLAHKDVLSTLPPEAAARLVNANYTLSRDVQSQSSVLLNWLWGKSTPKVVHM
ncbi:protein lava lamp isoform X2 [Cephus cinctus]|uniref:Protein lava lamp isoform X2 n=1 Tax=Cephus cinctus TaxID=211228 RepID=A0AAJ7FNJ1_CEPCN|nr:protein lava lamp isoform X2 [Cephus cinctus]